MPIDYIERIGNLIKKLGLRKMGTGFSMFTILSGLVYGTKIPPEVYSTLTTALIGAMFMGNVAEHLAKKDKPEG